LFFVIFLIFKNSFGCACIQLVSNEPASLPDDLAAAQAMILAERSARQQAEALVSAASLEIERLRLLLAKARREQFGQTSERGKRLIDQLELQLAELEEAAAEDEIAADAAAVTVVGTHMRQKPARRPLPAHLPRERVVVTPPATCRCCGGHRLAKVGEVVTETLDVVPRRWFVRQTVREKFTCRDCETISEPPAPFHVIPRARIGASLLAMILFEKYGCHQPLNRQSERYTREGVDIDVSSLADHVGAGAAALAPLHELICRHVLATERLHGDDTTVPVLARGKTITGRLWAYVRDDRPFGQGPPAVLFHYSRDRRGEHPERHLAGYAGILQADACSGFSRLYAPTRAGGPITEALCPPRPAGRVHFVNRIDGLLTIDGPMQGEVSSSLPISAGPERAHHPPWRWRPSAGLTRSSPTSARSTAIPPASGSPTAASIPLPWSGTS
jgi:transposase